jgi:uncharacterized protein GlcG (DUF336 family)
MVALRMAKAAAVSYSCATVDRTVLNTPLAENTMPKLNQLSTLTLCLAAAAANAQAVRTERNISLELASQIATATVAACSANGYNVATTVVDRAGIARVMQRADNAGPHTVPSSEQKAFTSLSFKGNTLSIMENQQKNPAAATLVYLPGILLVGGGVPIRVGNEVIGAVGVAGAPGGHLDEQCAMAGIDKVKDLLK